MKTSRAVSVVGLSAALVATGWAAGTGLLTPAHSVQAAMDSSPAPTGPTEALPVEPTASATPSPSGPTASASATPSPTTDIVKGDAVNTAYGAFQVEITVTDGKITDVALLQEGETDSRSRRINANAIPKLTRSVLKAQSAKVDAISGASYTSEGFLESVASAIRAAGL